MLFNPEAWGVPAVTWACPVTFAVVLAANKFAPRPPGMSPRDATLAVEKLVLKLCSGLVVAGFAAFF
jgi:hypothetical protein